MFLTPSFWSMFTIYGILFRSLKNLKTDYLHIIGICASFIFLYHFTSIGWNLILFLVTLLTIIYLASYYLSISEKHRGFLNLLILTIVFLWGMGKIQSVSDREGISWLYFVGFSFLIIKIWSYLKDLKDKRIKPNFLAFLHYSLYFPCFVSGPMHFYTEFEEALKKPLTLTIDEAIHHLFRITHGLVKVLIISNFFRPFSLLSLVNKGISSVTIADLLISSVAYSFVLYFDFSGYCDIVISSSSLFLGIKVPENFRAPYLASNIREFWQKWHITFTRFLTQYVFIPFTRWANLTLNMKQETPLVIFSYCLTFLFCGFWHGIQPNFLLWGTYHAAGLSGYSFFSKHLAVRQIFPPSTIFSFILTALLVSACFFYVSIGWSLFVLPTKFWFN